VMERHVPEVFERCGRLIAERRENPTDDLTSVLVHAEIDGERLEDHEIVMGFLLLMAAGNDSTKATYCSGMRALMENSISGRRSSRTPRSCPPWSRSRCACSQLRPLRPHRDPRHRAARAKDLRGREGRDVVPVVQSRRDALRGRRSL
jgi:hypothetical protein